MKDLIFYVLAIFAMSGWFYALYLRQEMKARQHRSVLPQRSTSNMDYSGAFAVPDTEAWWLAVHQIIDQAELETIQGARRVTHDSNRCIAAVGAGEGCELIRTKLNEARDHALTHYRAESVK